MMSLSLSFGLLFSFFLLTLKERNKQITKNLNMQILFIQARTHASSRTHPSAKNANPCNASLMLLSRKTTLMPSFYFRTEKETAD